MGYLIVGTDFVLRIYMNLETSTAKAVHQTLTGFTYSGGSNATDVDSASGEYMHQQKESRVFFGQGQRSVEAIPYSEPSSFPSMFDGKYCDDLVESIDIGEGADIGEYIEPGEGTDVGDINTINVTIKEGGADLESIEPRMSKSSESIKGDIDEKNVGSLYMCSYCKNIYLDMDTLIIHVREVHEEKKVYAYTDCQGIYPSKDALKKCIKEKHRGQVKYACDYCNMEFLGNNHLQKHIHEKHAENIAGKYLCSDCRKTFISIKHLRYHLYEAHGKKKTFKCHDCEKVFSNKGNMEAHWVGVHSNNGGGLKCVMCDRSFHHYRYLKNHLIKIHSVKILS